MEYKKNHITRYRTIEPLMTRKHLIINYYYYILALGWKQNTNKYFVRLYKLLYRKPTWLTNNENSMVNT